MPDDSAGKPPFKCGKCESRGLYRDDDRLNKASYIVCPICGNRWPGGPAPVMVEKKQEEVMGNKRGTCANCCRPDMTIIGRGLCRACYGVRVGRTGEALEKALAHTKGKLWAEYQESLKRKEKPLPVDQPLPQIDRGMKTKEEILDEYNQVPFLPPADSPPFNTIVVPFLPDDRCLYAYLIKVAKDEYRTPHQQILYMIDCNRQADLEAAGGGT
jgi:hypothetical protein